MKSAVIIVPTTGSKALEDTIKSWQYQTYHNVKMLLVVDGVQFKDDVDYILEPLYYNNVINNYNFKVVYLKDNVGANGFYGHRIYAAFSHLVNEDYVLFLDQDNWLEPNHVESLIKIIEDNGLFWSYSLRNIYDQNKKFICQDNCESLGKYRPLLDYNHVDTSCYCLKREVAITISTAWHGGWGQDRVVLDALHRMFPVYDTNGKHTLNYRLGGNEGSVKKEFFLNCNKIVEQNFINVKFPWIK